MSDVVIAKRFPLSIAIFVVLVLVAVSAAGVMVVTSHVKRLNIGSKMFADEAVSGMAASWTGQQLEQRLSPAARARVKPVDLQALAELRAKMGPFEKEMGATGGAKHPLVHTFIGSQNATYEIKAIFVNGVANFHFSMIKLDGRWMIDSYHIDVQYYGPPIFDQFNAPIGLLR